MPKQCSNMRRGCPKRKGFGKGCTKRGDPQNVDRALTDGKPEALESRIKRRLYGILARCIYQEKGGFFN